MEHKSVRCVYDPVFSKSKSKGPKPIYKEVVAAQPSVDPRHGRVLPKTGKWAVTFPLPPPEFFKAKQHKRCIISGLGPLITHSQLRDVLNSLGPVQDCQVAHSSITGASLGIGWAIFADARHCKQLCDIVRKNPDILRLDLLGNIDIKPDNESGSQFAAARLNAEKLIEQSMQFPVINSPPANNFELRPVELRDLSHHQVSQWFDKYIGPHPTYVLFHLSPMKYSAEEVSNALRKSRIQFKSIVGNRKGFFVLFDVADDAIKCFAKFNEQYLLGKYLNLEVRVNGEVPKHHIISGVEPTEQFSIEDMCKAAFNELEETEIASTWEEYMGDFMKEVIDDIVSEVSENLQQKQNNSTAASAPSVANTHGNATITTHLVSRLTMRKRVSDGTIMPKIKKRKYVEKIIEDTDMSMDEDDEREENGGFESKLEVKEEDDKDEDEDNILESEEEVKEEVKDEDILMESDATDDEFHGMDIPEVPQIGIPTSALGFTDLQRVVGGANDLEALQTALAKQCEKFKDRKSDEEIYKLLYAKTKPKLILGENLKWPPPDQENSFLLSPYRKFTDEERKTYLQEQRASGPHEIVENYLDMPLYQREVKRKPPKQRSLTKALGIRRTSKAVNSDLFTHSYLTKKSRNTRLARSAIHDWGLYASEPIAANEYVIEYVGELISDDYADFREKSYLVEGINSTYLFRLDDGSVIDATKKGNLSRFMNHSCDPNCQAHFYTNFDGSTRIVFFTLRDIALDEELTFDYKFGDREDDPHKVKCLCGSEKCKGWI